MRRAEDCMPSPMKFTSEIYIAWTAFLGSHDNGPPRTTLWRLTLTAYCDCSVCFCLLSPRPFWLQDLARHNGIYRIRVPTSLEANSDDSTTQYVSSFTKAVSEFCSQESGWYLLYKLLFSRGFYFCEFRESEPLENVHVNLCLFIVIKTSAKSRN